MKRIMFVFSVLAVFAMLVSACANVTTPAATQAPVVTKAPVVTEAPTPSAADIAAALPRDETLYFNGQQWSAVVGWNPYSNSNNNAMAIAQQDSARVIMFETPYIYDMLDGKVYPLLADGDYVWDAGMTQITYKIKAAAKWSDGTAVTADDAAYTWATAAKYTTSLLFQ
jgi:peptide/nickel transport system substrate-binding protein